MNRRRVLSALAIAALPPTAGCSTDDDVTLENFSNHDDLDVSFTGEVIQQPTKDDPPRIELQFTNDGAKRKMYFGPVVPASFREESYTLVSIPDNREPLSSIDPDDPDVFIPGSREDCWRALHNTIQRRYLQPMVLDTGDQLTERYTLLAHSDADECFPAGTYRFEDEFKIGEDHTLSFDVVVP